MGHRADVEGKAREIGARLIILDNAAQMFGGDEISRAEVTAFLNALNGLARPMSCWPPEEKVQRGSPSQPRARGWALARQGRQQGF